MSKNWLFHCDLCGFEMVQRHCKVICPNCGARWDCSDTTLWMGDVQEAPAAPSSPQLWEADDPPRP